MSANDKDIALAVIGGTGLYKLAALEDVETIEGGTIYGQPSGPLRVGRFAGRRMAFLARHGEGHSVPPHRINYRANLQRLKDLGVRRVLAINAVGGITEAYGPRVVACPDQIIDYTWGRKSTYFEGAEEPVVHVDFTHPYCGETRRMILDAAAEAGVAVADGGTYAATQGPRLETAAEIDRLERDGAHLVGMTGMPEAALARELDLPYAAICVVVNHAAGRGDSTHAISMQALVKTLDEGIAKVRALLEHLAPIATPPGAEAGR